MADADTPAESKKPSRGCLSCLVFLIAFVVALPFGISFIREQERLAHERWKAEKREECFSEVKNGAKLGFVFDPLLLPMLANDADCVANLEELYFTTGEIDSESAKHIARLANVKQIDVYEAGGVDFIVENARNLPIESMCFESVRLSKESLRSLSDFPKLREVYLTQGLGPEKWPY